MGKIIFFSLIIFSFIFAAVPARAAVPLGMNIKAAGSSAVYYYDRSGVKHAYPDMATLLSWYPDGKFNIRTISIKELRSLPTGENSRVKEGTLLKFGRLAAVYKSIAYGKLCYAASASFADNNFGFGWRQRIRNTLARLADYQIIGPCPEERGLPAACEVADPENSDVTVGGLRLQGYVKYAGPFTEDQKASLGSSLNGIKNINSFRAWTFENDAAKGSSTATGDFARIGIAMRLSFSSEADLEAAKNKIMLASGTGATLSQMPEMPAIQYEPCQVAGRPGDCLTVDPLLVADKLREICSSTADSTNTLQTFGRSLICSGLMFPAQSAFIFSEGSDLLMTVRVNMLMADIGTFVSTSSQSTAPIVFPDGFIMDIGQRDTLLAPFIDYLNQCKLQPTPTTTCANSGTCNLPPAPSTCVTGRLCQKTPCGPLANGGNSCETVEYVCYQYCAQDSDCSGSQTCQQLECYEGDAIEKDLRKVCR